MWHPILAYIKYRFYAKSKYRIHSPFVYNLITKSLDIPITKNILKKHDLFKTDLLNDNQIIEVKDYGKGSKIFKSNSRKVSDIAKYAGVNSKKAKILLQLTRYFKPQNILELGTSLGLASAAFSLATPKTKLTSIEGCPNTATKARHYLEKHQLDTIEVITGSFENILPQVLHQNKYDMIYFDGNHQKEATINYFKNSLQSIHNDTLCIFDDIHWSKEMEEAWEIIKNHHKTRVTIDLFDLGLVFFRKEQVKQNFVIKI